MPGDTGDRPSREGVGATVLKRLGSRKNRPRRPETEVSTSVESKQVALAVTSRRAEQTGCRRHARQD
jgi:hypothetical protein